MVGTNSFDKTGQFTLTSQGYVSPRHEDLTMPAMAATPSSGGRAIMLFTLSANEYIQFPNCTGAAFDPNTIGTCGGTRDGRANWGTSVNFVTP